MKLYTRSGDDGTTGLFGGERVPKYHPRVEAYGTVDELNASIGLAIAEASKYHQTDRDPSAGLQRIREILQSVQSRLFDLGADLATPHSSHHQARITRVEAEHVTEVERWIDEIDSANTPLSTFILPGGSEIAARIHFARTVSRRAERLVVALSQQEQINSVIVIYLNRISDMLFAMARCANRTLGIEDVQWRQT